MTKLHNFLTSHSKQVAENISENSQNIAYINVNIYSGVPGGRI